MNMNNTRATILTVALLLPLPAAAQLTPELHVVKECAEANKRKPFAPAVAAAITAACGSPSAVSATIAGGSTAWVALVALRKTARAAWLNYVGTSAH
jgi:hypothetical protein